MGQNFTPLVEEKQLVVVPLTSNQTEGPLSGYQCWISSSTPSSPRPAAKTDFLFLLVYAKTMWPFFLDFLAILQATGFFCSHWYFQHERMQQDFWGSLAMTVSSSPCHLPPFPLHHICPPFLTAAFISIARTNNFLQWGKMSAHLHLPPSIVTILCVWGLTLLHPCIFLVRVSSWNSSDGSDWVNLPGFSSHSCRISVWDEPPALWMSLAREGSTISHVLPAASDKDFMRASPSLWPGP